MSMTRFSAVVVVSFLAFSCARRETERTAEPATSDTSTTTVSRVATATSPATKPQTTVEEPKHFKFWSVKNGALAAAVPVTLDGPLDNGPWPASLETIRFLGNPVDKNVDKMDQKVDPQPGPPEVHLVAYTVKDGPPPNRPLSQPFNFSNQLAEKTAWVLVSPALLLVPAAKAHIDDVGDAPKTAEHYLCYVAKGPSMFAVDTLPKRVELSDQFDKKLKKIERIKNLQPAYLCFAVQKNQHNVLNADALLALYRIDPHTQFPYTVFTRDQFKDVRTLNIKQSEMLAVPSKKLPD